MLVVLHKVDVDLVHNHLVVSLVLASPLLEVNLVLLNEALARLLLGAVRLLGWNGRRGIIQNLDLNLVDVCPSPLLVT